MPFHRFQVERPRDVFQHAAPAFQKADELIVMMKNSLANNGADNRVQSRTIASAGKNADLHFVTSLTDIPDLVHAIRARLGHSLVLQPELLIYLERCKFQRADKNVIDAVLPQQRFSVRSS